MSATEPTSCDTEVFGAAACCSASERACIYAKALLARQAACTCARRQAVGEIDVVQCSAPAAQAQCVELAALMRERAVFALKLPRHGAPLLHAKALQLQCGGLRALQRSVIDAHAASGAAAAPPEQLGDVAPVTDVHGLIAAALACWGSLADAPWARIVPAMAAWQPRRRLRPGRP